MEKFSEYLKEVLSNEAEAQSYLNVALEQLFIDHNKALFLIALRQVIETHGGITKIAKETNISRQHLYKILSSKGNPSIDKVGSLLAALGFKLKVEANKAA
jgi:probable addiction module antidote protein